MEHTGDARTADWSRGLRLALAAAHGDEIAKAVWVTGSIGRDEAVPGSDVETVAVLGTGSPGSQVRRAAATVDLDGPPSWAPASPVTAADHRFTLDPAGWATLAESSASDPSAARGLVVLGLLADARPLLDSSPDPELLPRLAVRAVTDHPAVLDDLLTDALSVTASTPARPSSLFRPHPVVDLKGCVTTPLVKIARWAGLRAGSYARGTVARLTDGVDDRVLDPEHWAELRRAVAVLAELRWAVRLRADPDTPGGDRVPLTALTPTERAALRTAVRSVAGAQRTLVYLRSAGALRGPV